MFTFMTGQGFTVLNEDDGSFTISRYFDQNGKAVKKTKDTHPYNYDGFLLWRGGKNEEATRCVWTDRLYDWGYEKYNRLCMKHFWDKGQYFDRRNPKNIEEFLQDYMEDPTARLVYIMEYCNPSSGYPLWCLHYSVEDTLEDE